MKRYLLGFIKRILSVVVHVLMFPVYVIIILLTATLVGPIALIWWLIRGGDIIDCFDKAIKPFIFLLMLPQDVIDQYFKN